ncbi:MAG: hypothetical protein PWP67_802 [Clostridium butyricum]|nr:hypothetical protein [Clostridium butyricum]
MEYSAGIVSKLLWFVETRETAKLLQENSYSEVERLVIENNLYQQNKLDRIRREFNCIKNRLQALPEELVKELIKTDISTAKIIVFISAMATDLLLFEFVYEVYRDKLRMADYKLEDIDFNVFFTNKSKQSKKVSGWSDSAIAKIKQTYGRYLFEAGLIEGTKRNKKICRVYMDQDLRDILIRNNMEKYLIAITGER